MASTTRTRTGRNRAARTSGGDPGQGETAPDFTLPDQDGNEVTLSDLRGSPVVLYFYPRADTPGCTTQACGVRDHGKDYADAGAKVVGVSPDSVAAVKKFAGKHGLDFTLLADEDHTVAGLYGTWTEKNMYGKKHMGRAAGDLRDRSRRSHRPGLPQGLAEDPRRGRTRGAAASSSR